MVLAADSVAGSEPAPAATTVAPGRGEAAPPTPGRRRWAGSARSRPSELHPAALRDDRCHTGVPASGGGAAPPTDPPPARGLRARPVPARAAGRADRKSGGVGKRVELGGRRVINKTSSH